MSTLFDDYGFLIVSMIGGLGGFYVLNDILFNPTNGMGVIISTVLGGLM